MRFLFMSIKWPYLICLILLFVGGLVLFYPKLENLVVFVPDRHLDFTPGQRRLNHEEVYFNTPDGEKLHGWFFPQAGEYPVLLFFHGNAGNISHRLDNVKLLLGLKVQVFIFDYRGYGKSSGKPSERGLYRDGMAALDYLVKLRHFPPEKIILFGRSLGAAIALEVASKSNVRSIILESAFTSTREMAKNMFLFNLFYYFIPANYNNLKKIPQITVPKLIVHGEADDLVPFSMGQKLFKAARAPKYFLPLEEAGHNDTYEMGGARYFQAFATFVEDSKI